MCLKAVRFMLESIISKMEQVKPERLEAFMSLLEEKKALFKFSADGRVHKGRSTVLETLTPLSLFLSSTQSCFSCLPIALYGGKVSEKVQWEKYEMLKKHRVSFLLRDFINLNLLQISCDGTLELNQSLRLAEKVGCQLGDIQVDIYFIAVCDQKFIWAATAIDGYACGVCGLSSKHTVVAHADEGPGLEIEVRGSPFEKKFLFECSC